MKYIKNLLTNIQKVMGNKIKNIMAEEGDQSRLQNKR